MKKNIPNSNCITIVELDTNGSLYWHQSLEICLRTCFKQLNRNLDISININIDGLPLHNSTTKTFWPILFNIHEYPHIRPMAIGVFFGESKPKNLTYYFRPFVDEIHKFIKNGLEINGFKLSIKIRCFIADSPARAFIKGKNILKIFWNDLMCNFNVFIFLYFVGTAYFNGKHGCQKCTTVGKYSFISNTVIFTKCEDPPRTNEMFRNNQYEEHIQYYTPLLDIDIDMIQDFIVADPLHLLEGGVMKKLLLGWRFGDLGYATKWSAQDIENISSILTKIKPPTEMNRCIRSLKVLSFWKGLEFRMLLNYYGIVVPLKFLPKKYYDHFLQFFCAVTLCSSSKYTHHLNAARKLFIEFVKGFKELYGSQFITSNLHNLCHVVNDVQRFGELSTISAYPFENSLGIMKRLIRAGQNPLKQIARRLTERIFVEDYNFREAEEHKIFIEWKKNEKCNIIFEKYTLNNYKFEDMWFLTNSKEIMRMKSAKNSETNSIIIYAEKIQSYSDFFLLPFKSSFINIFLATISNVENDLKEIYVSDILCKYFVIENGNEHVFIPLLHTLK